MPLQDVVTYLTGQTNIADLTDNLMNSWDVSNYAIFTGGVADVYCATRPADGFKFAIKCIRQHNDKHIKRTARELHTWSKLNHNNILELSGLALFRGFLAMISPWMENGSVKSFVKKWPEKDRYMMCKQLVDGVKYLHSEEAIHGDIKGYALVCFVYTPLSTTEFQDNVLVAADGTLKLTDFGLAIKPDEALQFTTTDTGGGTIPWMAPELFTENPQRSREADVYAMGMTMLEIITGKSPFSELGAVWFVAAAAAQGRTPSIAELQKEPMSTQASIIVPILHRCWARDPKKRASAQEVASLIVKLEPA